jgi:hypothetical protein
VIGQLTVDDVRAQVRSILPKRVDTLDLEFFDDEIRQVGDYIVIGKDWGAEFRLDMANGSVTAVTTSGTPVSWYVNSGLQQLAACLEVHNNVRAVETDCKDDDHKWHAALQLMLADVARIDGSATEIAGNWWPVLAESLMI